MDIQLKFWKKENTPFTSEQEETIKKALQMNEMKELEYLMGQEELQGEHTFSPEFEQKMELLFQNRDLELEKKYTKKVYSFSSTPKTAMVTAFAVIVTILFVGYKTEAILLPKFIYTLQKDKGSYAYLIEQESYVKNTIEEKFELTYIPKGYKLQEIIENNILFSQLYVTEKGEKLIFQQLTKNSIIKADELIRDYKEMVFNESKFYINNRNNINSILWYANGYQYTIQINMINDELVKLAKSLEKQ